MATPKSKDTSRITPEEYLERERASLDQKHEYVDGEIFAMVGASPAHNAIIPNLTIEIGRQLKGGKCRLLSSEQKVKTADNGMFAYPDLIVVCGKATFHDEREDILTNPSVFIEVLSPSTEIYDRTEKFFRYQRIHSLVEYILVSQDKPRVEVLSRQSEGQWLYKLVEGIESNFVIPSIQCTVPLSEVYDRVWEDTE